MELATGRMSNSLVRFGEYEASPKYIEVEGTLHEECPIKSMKAVASTLAEQGWKNVYIGNQTMVYSNKNSDNDDRKTFLSYDHEGSLAIAPKHYGACGALVEFAIYWASSIELFSDIDQDTLTEFDSLLVDLDPIEMVELSDDLKENYFLYVPLLTPLAYSGFSLPNVLLHEAKEQMLQYLHACDPDLDCKSLTMEELISKYVDKTENIEEVDEGSETHLDEDDITVGQTEDEIDSEILEDESYSPLDMVESLVAAGLYTEEQALDMTESELCSKYAELELGDCSLEDDETIVGDEVIISGDPQDLPTDEDGYVILEDINIPEDEHTSYDEKSNVDSSTKSQYSSADLLLNAKVITERQAKSWTPDIIDFVAKAYEQDFQSGRNSSVPEGTNLTSCRLALRRKGISKSWLESTAPVSLTFSLYNIFCADQKEPAKILEDTQTSKILDETTSVD